MTKTFAKVSMISHHYDMKFLRLSGLLVLAACSTARTGAELASKPVILTGKAAYETTKFTVEKTGDVLDASGRMAVKSSKAAGIAMKDVADSEALKRLTYSPAARDVERTGKKHSIGDAALTPLSDANLRRAAIPEILTSLNTPYAAVTDMSCEGLMAQIDSLSAVLGPDLDIERQLPQDKKNRQRVRDTSVSVVQSTVADFIPFRSIVRLASGASAYEKRVRREYRKGVARRAYLRGLYTSEGCDS